MMLSCPFQPAMQDRSEVLLLHALLIADCNNLELPKELSITGHHW